jgi:hypothetical protein
MKKLIITIGCALAAQATYADDWWQTLELRRQTSALKEIEAQNGRIEKLLENQQQSKPRVTASITVEQMLAIEAENRAKAARDAARAAEPIVLTPLPSNGLDDFPKEYFGKLAAPKK